MLFWEPPFEKLTSQFCWTKDCQKSTIKQQGQNGNRFAALISLCKTKKCQIGSKVKDFTLRSNDYQIRVGLQVEQVCDRSSMVCQQYLYIIRYLCPWYDIKLYQVVRFHFWISGQCGISILLPLLPGPF